MSVKTKIIEIEPDWLLITFDGRKPDAAERAFWLKKTLADWLSDHPGRSIHATLPILRNGVLVAVNVWLENPDNPSKRVVFPKVHPLLGSLHKEYLEALLQHAYQIFFDKGGQSVLAAVNRRGIAVVFRGQSQKVEILPATKLRLEDHVKAAMDQWLAAPRAEFFVIEVPAQKPAE